MSSRGRLRRKGVSRSSVPPWWRLGVMIHRLRRRRRRRRRRCTTIESLDSVLY
jgi:hypothetical protein